MAFNKTYRYKQDDVREDQSRDDVHHYHPKTPQMSGIAPASPVIFIVPHKIQKRRLEDMKASAKKKGFTVTDSMRPNVTHIVTECETQEQAQKLVGADEMMSPEQNVEILSLKWFIECLKSSNIVPVQEMHRLKQTCEKQTNLTPDVEVKVADWACQRVARLDHRNKKFTNALEVLQEHAELRDGPHDYSRALAFRRASCVLKSLSFELKDTRQLEGLKDIGNHVHRVILDVLDHGSSDEVEEIVKSQWFKKMQLFTGVFGVGPSTANKWIDRGFESIPDVRQTASISADWRVKWGLAFWEELSRPVLRQEAEHFANIVRREAEKLLPGIIVTLCGGFRRGKSCGHDVDVLLSHPTEGAEAGILAKLLLVLQEKDLVLIGHREKGNFRPEVLHQDFKLSMRGQLDHFEKWLGICQFPKSFQENSAQDGLTMSQMDDANSSIAPTKNQDTDMQSKEKDKIQKNQSYDHSLDDNSYEPALKRSKLKQGGAQEPETIAASERSWVARRVDLIVAPYSQYYYALVGWTGSKHFNRDARLYASKVLQMKLTSHGLFDLAKKSALTASSEREVFEHLKLTYREPEERNC